MLLRDQANGREVELGPYPLEALRTDPHLQVDPEAVLAHAWVDGAEHDIAQIPRGTNERDLNLQANTTGKKSPVGDYNTSDNPPPNAKQAVPVNHKAAVARATLLESVQQARARDGQAAPAHYIPTATISE